MSIIQLIWLTSNQTFYILKGCTNLIIKQFMKNTDFETQPVKTKMTRKRGHDKISLLITNTFGSVLFLLFFILFILGWITLNLGWFPSLKPFDPFPFAELEMIVSIFAIFLSISVLISQKRQARLEKISQEVEFEINIRAEKEITKVLEMLQSIQKELGIAVKDQELEEMKNKTDLEALQKEAQQ